MSSKHQTSSNRTLDSTLDSTLDPTMRSLKQKEQAEFYVLYRNQSKQVEVKTKPPTVSSDEKEWRKTKHEGS